MLEVGMSDVIVTQGYVGVKILANLDNRTLCVARLVCEDWRKFIDAQLLWWNRIIEGCHLRHSFKPFAILSTKDPPKLILKIHLNFRIPK